MTFDSLTTDQIRSIHSDALRQYETLREAGLALDLTRGKPSAAQLDLSNQLLSLPGDEFHDDTGVDVRNYGGIQGNRGLRAIFSDVMNVPTDQVVTGDNASLSIMHDLLIYSLLLGTPDSPRPWSAEEEIAFICPVPGYDRHFALCEQYGITMISVAMNDDGPDVAEVREAVKNPAVKGMWLVPTYANPTGAVTSEAVAAELAAMETAAPDFRIMWDNAYAIHHLTDQRTKTADILGLCSASGHPNRPWIIASTSKVTFAGAGVSFFGSSSENVDWYIQAISKRTIGPDKVNQLRHLRFLKDLDGLHALMDAHRAILAPKFDVVLNTLHDRLGDLGVATWSKPAGGYFVNLDVVDGTASRVIQLAKSVGIAMTPAGAAFPHGNDPRDRNIRIAPSFPPVDELKVAMDGLATCVVLAASEQALQAEATDSVS